MFLGDAVYGREEEGTADKVIFPLHDRCVRNANETGRASAIGTVVGLSKSIATKVRGPP
jgi:hypothetical protein